MSSVAKGVREEWHVRTLSYRFTDAVAIIAGWILATRALDPSSDQYHSLVLTITILLYHVIGEMTGMYRNWRGVPIEHEIGCAVGTWLLTTPVLLTGSILVGGVGSLAPPFFGRWMLLTLVCTTMARIILRVVQSSLRKFGFNNRGYAIVGVNEIAFQLARNVEKSPDMGLNLVGFFDDREEKRTGPVDATLGSRIGDLDELLDAARVGEVSMIYIAFPMRAEERIRFVLDKLGDTTASVYLVPDFFVFELLHSRWTNIGGLPAVSVFENPFYGVDGVVKRSLDVVAACLLLAVLALPMAFIALLVKLSSPGSVFFRQRRYGLDGREILVWKFRSMTVCEDGAQVKQATKNDSRTTRIGAILRKTSLDELPQLFNVLNGTMSLVGPRPHASAHNEQYRGLIPRYMLRHKVRPGITGLAQVNGYRGETDTIEKMEGRVNFDHKYIREWSLSMDLRILFKTISVVFSKQNAY